MLLPCYLSCWLHLKAPASLNLLCPAEYLCSTPVELFYTLPLNRLLESGNVQGNMRANIRLILIFQ